MIEETTAEVAAPVVVEGAQEAPVSSEPVARDFEKEARSQGWVPEAEFKGEKRPAVFVDAETFVKRGEEVTPFIKKANKHLQELVDKQQKDFDARLAKIDRVNKATAERLEASHRAEVAQLKAQQRAAAEIGDVESFDRIERKLDTMAPPKEPEAEPAVNTDQQLEDAFAARNDWYGKDDDKTAIAQHYSQKLALASRKKHEETGDPILPMKENLEKVEVYMRERFPEKSDKPAANGHAAVDGGGAFNGVSQSNPLSRLPNEARAQAKVDMAKYPKVYPSAEAWIKAYEGKN